MRRLSSKIAVFLVCLLVLSIYWTGCGGKSDRISGPVEPVDYPVYFWEEVADNQFYSYHPLTNEIDSFFLPCQPKSPMTVSANGKLLFVNQSTSIAVVDLDSHDIIQELPYTGTIIPSPDGRWLAITGSNLYILRSTDYSVAFHDSVRAGKGSFSVDSKRLYCVSAGTNIPPHVRIIDIDNNFDISTVFISGGLAKNVIPSPDETLMFVYCDSGHCIDAFGVFSLESDSMIFWRTFMPGLGDLAMTPDGRHVFYSNPGPLIDFGECPLQTISFFRYDVSSNDVTEINTNSIFEDLDIPLLWVDGIEITPDGNWLVANQMAGSGILFALELGTGRFAHYVNLGGDYGRIIQGLTCQSSY